MRKVPERIPGKKIFGGGKKKEEQPPESPDGAAPAEPEAADKTAPAPRPASDVIRGLDLGDKQGLIGVLQNVLGELILAGCKRWNAVPPSLSLSLSISAPMKIRFVCFEAFMTSLVSLQPLPFLVS